MSNAGIAWTCRSKTPADKFFAVFVEKNNNAMPEILYVMFM